MSRRRKGEKQEWKLSCPVELALTIELMYIDPVTKKPDYGARSRLVTTLLELFVEVVAEAERDNPIAIKDKIRQLLQIGEHSHHEPRTATEASTEPASEPADEPPAEPTTSRHGPAH